MTTQTVRPNEPDDRWLLPPSPQEWQPEEHLTYVLSDLVDELSLTAILLPYRGSTRGAVPYYHRMRVKILSYADAVWIPASRQSMGTGRARAVGLAARDPDLLCRSVQPVAAGHQ